MDDILRGVAAGRRKGQEKQKKNWKRTSSKELGRRPKVDRQTSLKSRRGPVHWYCLCVAIKHTIAIVTQFPVHDPRSSERDLSVQVEFHPLEQDLITLRVGWSLKTKPF